MKNHPLVKALRKAQQRGSMLKTSTATPAELLLAKALARELGKTHNIAQSVETLVALFPRSAGGLTAERASVVASTALWLQQRK